MKQDTHCKVAFSPGYLTYYDPDQPAGCAGAEESGAYPWRDLKTICPYHPGFDKDCPDYHCETHGCREAGELRSAE
jgi:hypothetical protein